MKQDGTIVARQARMILDTGAYAGSGPELAVACLVLAGPYRIPHVHVDAYAVLTNKTSFGAYRGPSGPQGIFGLESHGHHRRASRPGPSNSGCGTSSKRAMRRPMARSCMG